MSDLISREALIDSLYSCEELKGRKTTEAVAKTIMEQPTVKTEPQWIPCSERLPEESGEYMVWYDCGEDMEGCCVENFDAEVCAFGHWCDEYDAHTLGFLDSEFIYFDEVIAWMPLPEPYKGE